MKVSAEKIKQLLDEAETDEKIFFAKHLVVGYKLKNGWTLVGSGACVDSKEFNIEIGRKVAREDVENQLWKVEGYLLQQNMHDARGE